MKVSTQSTLATPLDGLWTSMTDVDRVIAALPGASFVRDGDSVNGSLKCKLGSTQITYRLTAKAQKSDPDERSLVVAVTGKEARGSGTLAATLAMTIRAEGTGSSVEVSGDIEATGRGETAGMAAWARVIDGLVGALPAADEAAVDPAPDPAPEPTPPTGAIPPPVLSVAPADAPENPALVRPPTPAIPRTPATVPTPTSAFGAKRAVGIGVIALLILVLARRRRKHRG